ncbi:hypothetical protein MASR1M97_17660 [Candidatus Desulfobacillus denitrificans]
MDIHLLRPHQPVRAEQALHQRLQPVCLLDDDPGVLVQLGGIELPLEQLCRAPYAAERILDLVGKVADQFPVGLLLLGQTLFPLRLQLLIDRTEFEQQADVAGFHRRHRAVQTE